MFRVTNSAENFDSKADREMPRCKRLGFRASKDEWWGSRATAVTCLQYKMAENAARERTLRVLTHFPKRFRSFPREIGENRAFPSCGTSGKFGLERVEDLFSCSLQRSRDA